MSKEDALAQAVETVEEEFRRIAEEMRPPDNPQLGAAVKPVVWRAAKAYVVWLQQSGVTEASINKVGAALWEALLLQTGFLRRTPDDNLEDAMHWPRPQKE